MKPRRSVTIAGVLVACAALAADRPLDVQTAPTRPRLTGINHIGFRVRDEAAARRFYGDVLGLSRHPASGTGRIVYEVGDRQRVVLEPGLGANEDERLTHLAFDTPDVTALSTYLASRGITAQPVGQCQEGAVRVTDPDGHSIEFVAAKWPPDRSGPRGGQALSTRLLHAGLIVRDEEAAHRFYRDALGFSEIWRGGRKEGVTQWVNMRVPDGTDYVEYMLITAPPDRRQRGVLHHQALLVPDIQSAWEEAARRTPEADRAALSRPQVGVNGRWQLNLLDPDGTRTELMEPFTVR